MSPSIHWSKKQLRVVRVPSWVLACISPLGSGGPIAGPADCTGGLGRAVFPGYSNTFPRDQSITFWKGRSPLPNPESSCYVGQALWLLLGIYMCQPIHFYSSHVDKGYFSQMANVWWPCVCPDGWAVTSQAVLMSWLWVYRHDICAVKPHWKGFWAQR